MGGTLLQALWHGPALTALQRAALRSFVDHGYDLHLYAYDAIDVPAGVLVKDASEILPLDSIFYFKNPQTEVPDLGPFSDLFRFKLLRDRGGWYVDVDTFCGPMPIRPRMQAWSREKGNSFEVGTSQIALPAGGELTVALYEACLEASKTYGVREALGPHVITRTIQEMQLPPDLNGEPRRFYPVQWIEVFKLWLPEFREDMRRRYGDAMFLPYYQSLGRYMGFIEAAPPAGSFMDELVRRHADSEIPVTMSAEQVRALASDWFVRNVGWAPAEYRTATGMDVFSDLSGVPAAAVAVPGVGRSTTLIDAISALDEALEALEAEKQDLIAQGEDRP